MSCSQLYWYPSILEYQVIVDFHHMILWERLIKLLQRFTIRPLLEKRLPLLEILCLPALRAVERARICFIQSGGGCWCRFVAHRE